MTKINFDRFLEPEDDGFENYIEALIESLSEDFYIKNEKWILIYDGVFNNWVQKMFYNRATQPQLGAKVIERAHRIYQI